METPPAITPPTIVEPLPREKRRRLFLFLLTIFLCAVPIFVFYATGYRFDVFNTETGVTATGGLYIGVSQNNGEIFIDDAPARGSRIFRRATYIQSVVPGIHRVHVQGPGLQTWVKDLPVFPHMVTEADAFLLPLQPTVRLIASSTSNGEVLITSKEAGILATASSSFIIQNPYRELATTTATTTTTIESALEYQILTERFTQIFATTTSTTTLITPGIFRFATIEDDATSSLQQAATIVSRGNQSVILRDGELFAQHVGGARSTPHYFCVPSAVVASTSELYGAHVAYGIERARVLETAFQSSRNEPVPGDTRLCRTEIRLDTKGQRIIGFDFFPGSTDLVIVHQANGVFVVEIDDRAWQNVQTLIDRPVDALIVDNNRIFIKIDTLYFEVLTDLSNT